MQRFRLMAILNLGSVTLDEVKNNANSAYAASIISGEIHSVACRHSKNDNVVLAIEGKALSCKGFDGSTFIADGCNLYNPPLTRAIVEACDGSEDSIYIIKGVVTKTAPAPSKLISDIVQSKEDLMKEKDEIKAKFSHLSEADQKAASERMKAIETALKTA